MPDPATDCPACQHPANDHANPHGCTVDQCPCVLNPFTVGTLIGRAAHQAGVPGPHLHLGPPDTYVQTGPHNCHHDPGPYEVRINLDHNRNRYLTIESDSPVKITGSEETTDSRSSLENARRELAQQIADAIGPTRFWKDPGEPSQILNRIANDVVHPILYQDELVDPGPAEPEWADALVVRDREGDYAMQIAEGRWLHRLGVQDVPNDVVGAWGPITVVIDADGNNVEADHQGEAYEVKEAEFEAELRAHDRTRTELRSSMRREEEAEADRIREGDEWEAMYTEAVERAEKAEAQEKWLQRQVWAEKNRRMSVEIDQGDRRSEGRREAFTEIAEWADGRIHAPGDGEATYAKGKRDAYRSTRTEAFRRTGQEDQR